VGGRGVLTEDSRINGVGRRQPGKKKPGGKFELKWTGQGEHEKWEQENKQVKGGRHHRDGFW